MHVTETRTFRFVPSIRRINLSAHRGISVYVRDEDLATEMPWKRLIARSNPSLQSPILCCRLSSCCLPLVRSSLLTKQGGNGRADRPGICGYPRSGRWESALAFQNAARIWSNDACRRYTYLLHHLKGRRFVLVAFVCFGQVFSDANHDKWRKMMHSPRNGLPPLAGK